MHRAAVGVVAVALLALTAACGERAVPPVGRVEGTPSSSASPVAQLTAPTGRRWVGMNDVVVAVPKGWAIESDRCGDLERDIVRVLDGTESGCVARPGPEISALTVAPLSSGLITAVAHHGTDVDGVTVVHSGVDCRASTTGPCTLTFAVLEGDAAFRVTYRGANPAAFVEGLLESVTRLPAGLTTVPPVGFGRDVPDALRILERAGLEGRSPDPDWPHYATGTEPAVGSVVASGSTVWLTVGDG